MQIFKAILFGPGLPLTGQAVYAQFSGNSLWVKEPSIKVAAEQVTVAVGGVDRNEFYLHWQVGSNETFSLKLAGQADITIVMAQAPAPLQPQFVKWHKRHGDIKWVWGCLAAFVAMVALALLLFGWRYDSALSWLAKQVSVQQEEQLGWSALAQIESNGEVIKQGAAVAALRSIGEKLVPQSRYRYQWLVKNDKTANAFALPGGIVVVHSGLIAKAESADELAAVLAHEAQHIERQHALKNMVSSLGWATVLMLVLGDANTATAVVAQQLGGLYFSRDSEDEADRLGVQTLVNARIKPDGMLTVMQKLAKEPGTKGPEWLSSHPDPQKRIETIRTLIAQQPCPLCQPLAIDWRKIQQDVVLPH